MFFKIVTFSKVVFGQQGPIWNDPTVCKIMYLSGIQNVYGKNTGRSDRSPILI